MTAGVVGGIDRSNEEARQPDSRIRYLQTDLHTNPGSSGGPLLTRDGNVIGMVTTRADVDGVTFAIQLSSVRRMIEELMQQRRVFRPWLGFKGIACTSELWLQVMCPERRELLRKNVPCGVLVTKVHAGSPGSAASLRPGDIITHANGDPVGCLGDILGRMSPTDPKLSLTLLRIVPVGKTLNVERFTSQLTAAEFDILFTHHGSS